MENIHGLIDAPFTPFYANGEVNYEPIQAYADLLARNGLKGVLLMVLRARAICLPRKNACCWLRLG